MSQEILLEAQAFYRNSIFHFATEILNYPDVNRETHGSTIEALEAKTKRKLICVPRGCLKSTIACVTYPIWLLLHDFNLRILIDSELFTNSATFLREIKSHLVSPKVTAIFGEFKSRTWNESEIIVAQRTRNLKEASITVGGVGTTKVGQHYDYIIHDDMNSPDNSSSPEKCEKVINHYRYNTSILEPTGTMVLVGTRYSENDCIGHVLRNELGIEGIPLTGIYDVQDDNELIKKDIA